MIVLGIDTAIRKTGYGVIEFTSVNRINILDCGMIVNSAKLLHSECLRRLHGGVEELIRTYRPDSASIESAFVNKNIKTAMILSLARGAVIASFAESAVPVYEYSPKTAKRAATGSGDASKEQVASILASMCSLDCSQIPLDSTDALALALCHGNAFMRGAGKSFVSSPI